jgi:hypothetical protein
MDDHWEQHKDIMQKLFLKEDKTYEEVMEAMGKYNFRKRYSPV